MAWRLPGRALDAANGGKCWARVWRSELTPLAFLERSAADFRERPAVLDGTRSYSYAELGQRVRRLASALRGAGVGRNDRVAFLAPNAPPLLEAHLGVPMAGAVLVAINTRLSADEVAYILDHSSSHLLFAGGEFALLVARVRERVRALRWPRRTTACKRARSVSGDVIVGAGGATAIVAMRRSFRAHEPPPPVNSNLD